MTENSQEHAVVELMTVCGSCEYPAATLGGCAAGKGKAPIVTKG